MLNLYNFLFWYYTNFTFNSVISEHGLFVLKLYYLKIAHLLFLKNVQYLKYFNINAQTQFVNEFIKKLMKHN